MRTATLGPAQRAESLAGRAERELDLDLRKDTDYVTVSKNVIAKHNKAFGIGWTENPAIAKITINDNYFHSTNVSLDPSGTFYVLRNSGPQILIYFPRCAILAAAR